MILTSLQNPRVKEAIKLRNRNKREEAQTFLIEGYRELLRAAEANHPINELFFCPELFLGENENTLIERLAKRGAKTTACKKYVFEKLSYRDRPDGLLAIAPQKHVPLPTTIAKNPFYIVAEAIEKPGNLGTILRSSDAAGVDGLIVCDRCTDIHNPNVVRASVGTLFTVPLYEASSDAALHWLKANGIQILAATPSAKHLYTEVDMTAPLAIVVGTEQLGLSDQWMKEADLQVKIPMKGVADSLNVATATTLLLFEAVRQRR